MKMIIKLFLSLLVLILSLAAFSLYKNDVPWRDDPGFISRLMIYTTKNTAQSSSNPLLPELRIKTYAAPATDFFDQLIPHLIHLGWEVQSVDKDQLTIHAVVSSSFLQFKDDVVIRLESTGKRETRLHIRSTSRTGRADFGANLGHILKLYQEIYLYL